MENNPQASEKQITVSGIRNLATSHGYLLRKLHNMRGAYLLYDPLGESVIGSLAVLYEDLKSWTEKDEQRTDRLMTLFHRTYPLPSGLNKLVDPSELAAWTAMRNAAARAEITAQPPTDQPDQASSANETSATATIEPWYDAAF